MMSWVEQANQHFLACHPNEGVGYVKDDVFYPLENTAEDKEHDCEFDGEFLIKKPDLIVHSHTTVYVATSAPDADMRAPSYVDMVNQRISGVEWAIIVTDGQTCLDPIFWGNPNHRPDLHRREFIYNVQDCLSLVQDWYYATLNRRLPDLPRDPEWDQQGQTFMEDNWQSWGFVEVPWEEKKFGDVIMMKLLSQTTNHLAIVLDETTMFHHGYGQLPIVEPSHKWKKRTVRVVRPKETT